MSRLLYEYSFSHQGHLIIPFVFRTVDGEDIYSYRLLSEMGEKGKFHKAENPSEVYSASINGIVEVAKEHLNENSDVLHSLDLFKSRYTYRHNLIIVCQMCNKYFYDHYPPEELRNIAAPKIFESEIECINWVKEGLERSRR